MASGHSQTMDSDYLTVAAAIGLSPTDQTVPSPSSSRLGRPPAMIGS